MGRSICVTNPESLNRVFQCCPWASPRARKCKSGKAVVRAYSQGVDTHEMVETSDLVQSLGCALRDGLEWFDPWTKRYRRLFGALWRLSAGRRCISRQDLEKVVTHATFVLLLKKPLLSVLNKSVAPWVSLRQ